MPIPHTSYKQLAERLDALPNGFPPTPDGQELALLAHLFTPEEAALAASLRLTLESPQEIADRLNLDPKSTRLTLKQMARNGLVRAGKTESGVGYGLLPFVVGIYEYQVGRIDAELATLFEAYYQKAYGQNLAIHPQVHRVVPVNTTVKNDMEVQPYERVTDILDNAQAWGVVDCICRKQKALIGDPCEHPLDVCMVLSRRPGAFDNNDTIRALTQEEAHATLYRAAEAGLVHSVSNTQNDLHYICNCCTCSCGILRGMAELGIANVIARSAFVNTVDTDLCLGCQDCEFYCQFEALELDADGIMQVYAHRCVGCGVCVPHCPEEALTLVRRPEDEIKAIPATETDWLLERAAAREIDIRVVA